MPTETKTVLSISKDTPKWAKWTYRITFAATTAACFVVSSDNHIPAELRVRIIVYLKGIDMLVYTILQGFGVSKHEKQDN